MWAKSAARAKLAKLAQQQEAGTSQKLQVQTEDVFLSFAQRAMFKMFGNIIIIFPLNVFSQIRF